MAADKTDRTQQQTFVAGVQKAVRVAFGNRVDTLADFGLPLPKTRTPLTPEQKQAAVAKAKATRAARHTMGAKQRVAITGEASLGGGESARGDCAGRDGGHEEGLNGGSQSRR